MAHQSESRRSEAAPAFRSAEPDTLQPTLAPEAPPAGALTLAPQSPPPATHEDEPPPDIPDYDPADYRWVPVRRKPRLDGWTEEKQRRFIETLADTGLVGVAAKEVGMSRESAHRLRRSPHAVAFARAWDAARHHAGGLIEERQVKHAPGMFQDRPGDGPTCRSPSNARSRASSTRSTTTAARSSARASSTTIACSNTCSATSSPNATGEAAAVRPDPLRHPRPCWRTACARWSRRCPRPRRR